MLFYYTALVLSVLVALTLGAGDQSVFKLQNEPKDIYAPILDDEFAAWLEETGNARGMQGVAIAVTRKNKDGDRWTTETKGFGVADRWGAPVDDETLFSIASNSKLFTALGIGLLTVNESIPIDWDTKIKDILPESLWALQDPIAQDHADLVDILSHRTGLPRHDLSYGLTDTLQSSISKLRHLRPSAEFRQTHQYNNQMYVLASYIISYATGTPFHTFITENIISPLGLNWTTYNSSAAMHSGKLADGFLDTGGIDARDNDKKPRFKPVPCWNLIENDLSAGPGGVISNAKDLACALNYATWLQALLLSGRSPVTNDAVIPSSIVELVTDGVSISVPRGPEPELSPSVYGMGQRRYTYQGHEFIEHAGATIGHLSVVTRSTHDGLGVAVLINTMDDPAFLDIIKWRIIEKALGLKQIDWNTRYPKGIGSQHNVMARPSDGLPSTLPLNELAGIYFNPAYGTLTLCPYPPSEPVGSPRIDCDGVISEALQPLLNHSAPVLLAKWSKVWSSHVFLYHVSGDKFDMTTVLTFPPPFPDAPRSEEDSHPFAVPTGNGSAEFIFDTHPEDSTKHVEGIACTGLWGAGIDVKPPKGGGRESAEVWFDKVS